MLREALHNSYDATGKNVYVIARGETLTTGNRGLTLNFQDDGDGMNSDALKKFSAWTFRQTEFDRSSTDRI